MHIQFSDKQLSAIQDAGISLSAEDIKQLFSVDNVAALSEEHILTILKIANAAYRAGFPIIDDSVYDTVYLAQLIALNPQHDYLHSVEPEPLVDAKTIALPQKMLSTEKAYSRDEIERWVNRVLKAANELDIDTASVAIKVTPKLDGYAAYDDGQFLYTRGDGNRGQDITRAFVRGLQVANQGARGQGAGEIVIRKSYFDENLSEQFENSRNIQASIIAEKKIDPQIQEAIDDGACVFFPFALLPSWEGYCAELLASFEVIADKIWNSLDYDVDGIILEATSKTIKDYMGATRHHHKWQIAYKINEATAEVRVNSVTAQTSRTGRLTPVAELEPTKLSGATISRATVHHYGMVKANGVGAGAIVLLVRSGLVIPKIEKVLQPVTPQIPENCPSCGAHVVWDGDHLICPNTTECPAQTENTLSHFFKTLANVDGFGPKVITKLYQAGAKKIHDVYLLKHEDFVAMGFGDKTSQNLIAQLQASRTIEIEDWRFLAAFGIPRLGLGNCEKLLTHHQLVDIFNVSINDIIAIEGFAELTAEAVYEGLKNLKAEFFKVYGLAFNLKATKDDAAQTVTDSPIAGKQIVFTGTMQMGSRTDMEKNAKRLGAKVGKSVTKNTSFLVMGADVGANKLKDAQEKGVAILTEAQYCELIGLKV